MAFVGKATLNEPANSVRRDHSWRTVGNAAVNKLIRTIALFFLHLLLAVVATAIVKSGFTNYGGLSDPAQVLRREYIFSSIAAFGLGWFTYRILQHSESKWVWIAGLLWFVQRAALLWLDQRAMLFGAPHTVLTEILGLNCSLNDARSCTDVINYTIPCVRTIAYSVGAVCCSRWWPRKSRAGRDRP
jgi:hypothetical protein